MIHVYICMYSVMMTTVKLVNKNIKSYLLLCPDDSDSDLESIVDLELLYIIRNI